jgi:autotransporter-associated beta strand protein
MTRTLTGRLAAAAAVAALFAPRPAPAQTTYTWTGAGGNPNWTTPGNWGGTAPPSDPNVTRLVLTGNTNTATVLDLALSANSLTFDAAAGAFTVGGTSTLTLGSGGVTVASNANQAVNVPLALGANQTWANNGAGLFTVGGTITGGANNLTVGGPGNTTFAGAFASLGTLTKAGAGVVTFAHPDAFGTPNTPTAYGTVATGDITVTAGELVVGNLRLAAPGMNPNRGTGARNLAVASGAVVTVTGTLSLDPGDDEYVTQVAGPGTVRLRNPTSSLTAPSLSYDYGPSGGDASPWGSVITATVDVGPGTHWVVGKANRNDISRYAGDLRFDAPVTGPGNLQFRGTNVNGSRNFHAVLNAASPAFTGGVLVANADLNLTKAAALSAANPVTFNTVADAATQNDGKLFLWGYSVTIGSLNDTSEAGTNNFIRNGAIAGAANGGTNANGNAATLGVALGRDADSVLTITQSVAGVFHGVIADGPNDDGAGAAGVTYRTLGVVKAGPAALTLTGSNTYTGGTTVAAGTLLVSGQTGASSGTGTGPVIVSNSGTRLGGTGRVAGAVTVNNGAQLRAGDASGSGTLTLGGGLTLTTGAGIGFRVTNGSTPSGTPGGSTVGAAPNPTSNNFVHVTAGGLTVAPADIPTLRFVIDGTGTAFTPGQPYSYRVAQVFTSPGVPQDLSTVQLTGAGVQGQFSTVGFQAADFSLTGDAGGFLYVGFTPVPEPVTVLALAAAGLGLGRLRRRPPG